MYEILERMFNSSANLEFEFEKNIAVIVNKFFNHFWYLFALTKSMQASKKTAASNEVSHWKQSQKFYFLFMYIK